MKSVIDKAQKFLKEAYAEFQNVTWPKREQTIRLTAFVIGVSLGVALFSWLVDLIFKEMLSFLII